METILALFQAILLLFAPMGPVTLSSVQSDLTAPSGNEWREATPSAKLARVVENELKGTKGKYSIYIKHLASGESYAKDAERKMLSASMYKAWLAAGVLEDVRSGKSDLDEKVSDSIQDLNRWAGLTADTAELSTGSASYTISDALEQMIGYSHNYSAFLLTKKIGNPKVQEILKKQGLEDSIFERPPKVSASDMALFYERVYRGRFFEDEKYSKLLRDLLASNEVNNRIPKFLPAGTRVEHKTGELNEFIHDCGIVYSSGGDYIICVMTESKEPQAAAGRIADVSLAVYNYFN